jgi:hypothetical protein
VQSPLQNLISEVSAKERLLHFAKKPNDKMTFLDDDFHFITGKLGAKKINWEGNISDLPGIISYLKASFRETGNQEPNDTLLLALLTFQKASCFEAMPSQLTNLMALEQASGFQYEKAQQRISIIGSDTSNDEVFVRYEQNINGVSHMFSDTRKFQQPACLRINYRLTGGNTSNSIQLSNAECTLYSTGTEQGATKPLSHEMIDIWNVMSKEPYFDPTPISQMNSQLELIAFFTDKKWAVPPVAVIQTLLSILENKPNLNSLLHKWKPA